MEKWSRKWSSLRLPVRGINRASTRANKDRSNSTNFFANANNMHSLSVNGHPFSHSNVPCNAYFTCFFSTKLRHKFYIYSPILNVLLLIYYIIVLKLPPILKFISYSIKCYGYHRLEDCTEINVWLKMNKPEHSDYINQNSTYFN